MGRPTDAPFGIVVDDETMKWVSDPPGRELLRPERFQFSSSGAIGSGKEFEVHPGGRALEVKSRR